MCQPDRIEPHASAMRRQLASGADGFPPFGNPDADFLKNFLPDCGWKVVSTV